MAIAKFSVICALINCFISCWAPGIKFRRTWFRVSSFHMYMKLVRMRSVEEQSI